MAAGTSVRLGNSLEDLSKQQWRLGGSTCIVAKFGAQLEPVQEPLRARSPETPPGSSKSGAPETPRWSSKSERVRDHLAVEQLREFLQTWEEHFVGKVEKVLQTELMAHLAKQHDTEVVLYEEQSHRLRLGVMSHKNGDDMHELLLSHSSKLETLGAVLEGLPVVVAEKVEFLLKRFRQDAKSQRSLFPSLDVAPPVFLAPATDVPLTQTLATFREQMIYQEHSEEHNEEHTEEQAEPSPSPKLSQGPYPDSPPPSRSVHEVSHGVSHEKEIDWSNSKDNFHAMNVARGWEPSFTRPSMEKERMRLIRRWVDWGSMALIMLNSVFLGVESEIRMKAAVAEQNSPHWLWWGNFGFAVAFSMELLLKLALFGKEFFTESVGWNLFDTLLVLSSIADIVFEVLNISFLRSLRIIRAVRATRIMRTIGYVQELRLMVASILSSLPSLGWAFILLLLLLYLYALVIMQGVEVYLRDTAVDPILIGLYGGLGPSIMSLFMSISGGVDWGSVSDPLRKVSGAYLILFMAFVTFVVFGVLNILTAVFIEASRGIIEIDRDLVVQQNIAEESSTVNHLKRLFRAADTEGSGNITREQINVVFSRVESIALLKAFGLDVTQAHGFFVLLDMDMSNHVDIDEFVGGLMRLRGHAKGVDVATIMYENKRLFQRFREFMKDVDGNFHQMKTNMAKMERMTSDIHLDVGKSHQHALVIHKEIVGRSTNLADNVERERSMSSP